MTIFANIKIRAEHLCILKVAMFLSFLTPIFWTTFAHASTGGIRCGSAFLGEKTIAPPYLSKAFIDKSHFETLTQKIGDLTVGKYRLSQLLNQDAGVSEGYSVRKHIHRVFTVYSLERIQNLELLGLSLGKTAHELDLFMTTVIVLHDIGKPLAVQAGDINRQHEFTIPIMAEALRQLGWNSRDIDLAKALVGNDYVGQYLQGNSDVYSALSGLESKAHQVHLPLDAFLKIQLLFYKIDAGSYPLLAELIFTMARDKTLQFRPGRLDLLLQISKKVDLSKTLIAAKAPRRVEKLRKQWLGRQEVLFEKLFSKLNFGKFASYEQRLMDHIKKVKTVLSADSKDVRDLHVLERLEDLKEEKVEIRIRTSLKFLESILTEGYKNKSEGGGGSLQDGRPGDLQDLVEASFLGAQAKDIAALPAELRPRFGFLSPSPQSRSIVGIKTEDSLFKDTPPDRAIYSRIGEIGDITLILDPKEYEGALTLTAGDSANTLQHYKKARTATDMTLNTPTDWSQIYVPWKYRMVFQNYLKSENYTWNTRGHNLEYSLRPDPKLAAEEIALSQLAATFVPQGIGPDVDYFEVQIWKPIRKIQAIEISSKQEVPQELRALLEKLGIKIQISR